jgi:hypothetical protein
MCYEVEQMGGSGYDKKQVFPLLGIVGKVATDDE